MTMIDPYIFRCPICGEEFEDYVLASSNQSGASDLDTRPPEMIRSTMNIWIHECSQCGYAARDFDEKPQVNRDFIESDIYQNIGFEFKSDLAKSFYREYLILKEEGCTDVLFHPLLNCAWACDDFDDTDNAVEIRKMCAEIIGEDTETLSLIRLDLLRRSRQFDRVIEEYSSKTFSEEILNKICTFSIIKAKSADDACYTVEDAMQY
ncbi:MAG: hypothetical protein IJ104_11150 [Methanobrevibacter sp.]|nr:hypothetical protein [Methanobrevibacter sp.]